MVSGPRAAKRLRALARRFPAYDRDFLLVGSGVPGGAVPYRREVRDPAMPLGLRPSTSPEVG